MHFHKPNMVSSEVVSGGQHTPLIRAYDHIPELEEALNRLPGKDYIILRDLNVYTRHLHIPQIQQVAYSLLSIGLVDLLSHFRQRLHFQYLKTWWKVQQGRFLNYGCKYILGSDCRLFKIVRIRGLRKFASDPFSLCTRVLKKPT